MFYLLGLYLLGKIRIQKYPSNICVIRILYLQSSIDRVLTALITFNCFGITANAIPHTVNTN